MMSSNQLVVRHKLMGYNTPSEMQAQRMNRNEGNRLRGREKVFDRMVHRSENLINNEIKLVRQTLRGISSSSGILLQSDIAHEEPTTFFMYGERLQSRRYGRRVTLMRYLQEQRRRDARKKIESQDDYGWGVSDSQLSPGDFFADVVTRVEEETRLDLECEHCLQTSAISDEDVIDTVMKSNSKLLLPESDQLTGSSTIRWSGKSCSGSGPTCLTDHEIISSNGDQDQEGKQISLRYSRHSSACSVDDTSTSWRRPFSRGAASERTLQERSNLGSSLQSLTLSNLSNKFLDSSGQKLISRTPDRGRLPRRSYSRSSFSSQSTCDRAISDPVLPVEAYVNTSHPEEEFAKLHFEDRFLFSRPSVYAPTISSRQKSLSSFIVNKKR